MTRTALAALCVVALFACDSKEEKEAAPPKGAPDTAAPKKADAPPAAEKPKVGLDLPGNDPKVVALARKAMNCAFEKGDYKSGCDDHTAWKDEEALFADNKADATLVAMLEDPDEKVRLLASERLSNSSGGAFADKALAERLLTVAEKLKKDLPNAGRLVGHVNVKATETFPRVKAMVDSADLSNIVRGEIIENLLAANPDNDDVFKLTTGLIADAQLGRSAFLALDGGHSKAKETCALYAKLVDGEDLFIATRAAQKIPEFPCPESYDGLIKSLEARAKGKKFTDGGFAEGLMNLCKAKDVKAPQTKKALALAHKVTEDKKLTDKYVRSSALEASVACDPKGGKKYAAKFVKDADEDLKSKAEKLSK